jgi:hypothetical protein
MRSLLISFGDKGSRGTVAGLFFTAGGGVTVAARFMRGGARTTDVVE